MRKTEQRLWDRMRGHLSPRGFFMERVENAVGEGTPDVTVLYAGIVTPTELKAVEEPPTRITTRLLPSGKGLSVTQLNWHLAWAKAGGRSLILVGCGSRLIFGVDGIHADEVNDWSLENFARGALAATWDEVAWHYGARP